jgi:hypothetical protein
VVSLDHVVDLFLVFLKTLHISFHRSCAHLHPTKSLEVFLSSPTFWPTFVVVCVIHDSHCDSTEVETQCGLICFSFTAKGIEHFFIDSLAMCTSSFENCLFSSFAHLFGGLLIFWEFRFLSSLHLLIINPLLNV